MSKVLGAKVKLYIEDLGTGQVLAGQRNANLNRSVETINSTSKDSENDWTELLSGFKSWSIDADGALITDDTAYQTLETVFINGDLVVAYIEMPSGQKYRGICVITDFSNEFPFDDLAQYSITLQASGALEIVAPV
jgi:TP901-1 family phage major tail protein